VSRLNRNTENLTDQIWDLLVVGGGIFGSWIALDAALRGLQVALVERGDFASQTSANSLKIIHGGFRYLKRGDLKRLRQSAREVGILMRAAPHLIGPLAVAIPARGRTTQSKPALSAALKLYRSLTVSDLTVNGVELVPPGSTISPRDLAGRLVLPLRTMWKRPGSWFDPGRFAASRREMSARATPSIFAQALWRARPDLGVPA
jgi:glycerol-3-phosphate dehydrogenase